MTESEAKSIADFLNHIGYRRVSRKYHRVSRLDRKDWLEVLAKNHFGDFDWAYNVGPSQYLSLYSKDTLEIPDQDIFLGILPNGSDVRTSGYWELTENNKLKLEKLLADGIVRRA